jgi:methyl-accepting chemotaxis protein
MIRWYADLSVKLKLALGFGLVLLFTLLITLTGWSSLSTTIERDDKLNQSARFSELTKDLGISRLAYQLQPDATTSQAVNAALAAIETHGKLLKSHFSDPHDLQLITEQEAASDQYRSVFAKLQQTYQDYAAIEDTLRSSGAAAVALILQIETRILNDISLDESSRLEQFRLLSQLRLSLQQTRFQALNYTTSNNDPARQKAVSDALDTTHAHLEELGQAIGREDPDLRNIDQALQNYRSAIAKVSTVINHGAELVEQMHQAGARILQVSQQLVEQQTGKRDQTISQARSLLIGASVLALLISLGAAALITAQITRPLQYTLRAAERIAAGDLSQDLHVTRRDEMGQLQRSIQAMTQSLRELIGHIRDSVSQIASAAEELSAVTEQTSAGVNSQRAETDQVATAMNQMTATVQEVARNAEQASTAASAADRQAQEGEAAVNDAVTQMDKLAGEVSRSNDAVSHLQQESLKIGSALDVIKAVADQTNLLALNAAIEAARAGDAGRGFAVVADEVRGLAQRTQQSTAEIEALIASLQNGTQQAASLMDNSRSLTESTVELTRRAGQRLGAIAQSVSSIQSMNQQIATAAEQQSAVAKEINRSVINVRDISEQTSAAHRVLQRRTGAPG